jgi:hypothetical protein
MVRIEGKSVKEVLFPFCATSSDFKEAIKRRKLNRADPEVVKILADLKPWKGGQSYSSRDP